MDTNNDEKLSREEWIARFGNDNLFDAYDTDRDGVIDPMEWLQGQAAMKEFDEIDLDSDRKLSRDECALLQ